MKPRFLPAMLLLLLFSSCTVYREYRIEVYKPGELVIPPQKENAALIYRNFKYQGDTLQHFYRKENQLIRVNDPHNLDSILINVCLNELAINLKNNNVFNEVPIFPYHTFDRHVGDNLTPLPEELIARLSQDATADLLITLETLSTFFSTYPETFDTPHTNEVVTIAVWGIYDPEKHIRIEQKTMIDTIYWNGYDTEGNLRQNYKPPPRHTALELASAMAGESFAKRFYASWQTESRMYSVPPLPDFSNAAVYLEEEKWDEAIVLWQKYIDDRNGKMAIDARYNIALAFEMKDDLNAARKWLASAYELAQSYRSKNDLQMIQLYQKTLDRRQKEILFIERMKNENMN